MDFHNPDRRVTLIAVDEKWTRLLPWAVVAAIAVLAFGLPQTPEVKAKPVEQYADKFEWILMEPRDDGSAIARTFRTRETCVSALVAVLDAKMAEAGSPGWKQGAPPECVPGKLIESPRS